MPKKKPHLLSRLRYYITLLASVVAIFAFFALLFLVPFVFDPAISALSAGFPEQPATCLLTSVELGDKLSKCNWTSCSEGCTAPLTTCVQVRVDVSHVPYAQFGRAPADYDESVWQLRDVPLKINIQSCGYPPLVNCTHFWHTLLAEGPLPPDALPPDTLLEEPLPETRAPLAEELLKRRVEQAGTFPVPCYPSSELAGLVVYRYSASGELFRLVMAAAVPAGSILLAVGFLCYCYCGWCRRSCPQLRIPGETDTPKKMPPELTISMATSVADGK